MSLPLSPNKCWYQKGLVFFSGWYYWWLKVEHEVMIGKRMHVIIINFTTCGCVHSLLLHSHWKWSLFPMLKVHETISFHVVGLCKPACTLRFVSNEKCNRNKINYYSVNWRITRVHKSYSINVLIENWLCRDLIPN